MNMMYFYIKSNIIKSRYIELDNTNLTIKFMKTFIENKTNFPANNMVLLFQNQILSDDKDVNYYKIKNNDIILLTNGTNQFNSY
jgi:hypothetical protein